MKKKAILYYTENNPTLWQCLNAVTSIVDNISAASRPNRTMGSGFNANIEIMAQNLNEQGTPRIRLHFNDFQTKNNNHVTGACAGYFKALSDAGRSRQVAQIDFNSMGSPTSITFNSLQDLVLSLNARTQSQDEKISMDGVTPRPIAIG